VPTFNVSSSMDINPVDVARMKELAKWFEQHKNEIPNSYRLIHKLRNDQQVGHLVNVEFVKRFCDDIDRWSEILHCM